MDERTTQVRILGNQYLVTMDGKSHVVGKDKRCHTCRDECLAVHEVARYLKAGGRRAPDTVPTRAHPPQPATMPPCPICGAKVERKREMDRLRHGRGWRCSEGGYAHLYLHRYGHLEAWFCGEGKRRHHVFVRDEDEPAAVQLCLPKTKPTPAKVIPFPKAA